MLDDRNGSLEGMSQRAAELDDSGLRFPTTPRVCGNGNRERVAALLGDVGAALVASLRVTPHQ